MDSSPAAKCAKEQQAHLVQQEQGVTPSETYLLCFTFAAYGEFCQVWQRLCIFLSRPQLGCLLEDAVAAFFTAAIHIMILVQVDRFCEDHKHKSFCLDALYVLGVCTHKAVCRFVVVA